MCRARAYRDTVTNERPVVDQNFVVRDVTGEEDAYTLERNGFQFRRHASEMKELDEFRWWCCPPLGKGDGGAKPAVGVGTGVFWLEETADSEGCCLLLLTISPV